MDKPKVFPPEFIKLEKPLQNLQARNAWIDNRIKELERDRPQPYPNGPGLNFRPTPNDAWNEIKTLAKEKQDLIENYDKNLDEVLADADPKTNRKVRGISSHQLSQNQYKGESREQLKMHPFKEKHFDKGMDFMVSLHFNKFRTPDVPAEINPYGYMNKETLGTHEKRSKPSSLGMDFMESLHNSITPPTILSQEQKSVVADKGGDQTKLSPPEKLSLSLENPNNFENIPDKEDVDPNISTRTDADEPEPSIE